MITERESDVLHLVQEKGILRPRDLTESEIPRVHLYNLARKGALVRIGRGLYVLPATEISEHYSLAVVARLVPGGVICLLSALRYHDLGTALPHRVWIAIGQSAKRPTFSEPPISVVHFSGKALTEGIQEHEVMGVPVSVYSPEKTLADCFKSRNRIGVDVCVEALEAYLTSDQKSLDALWHFADICRVQKVMRPYLEALQ